MATTRNTRFGELVRASGRPHVVTLWTDPRNDHAFGQAVQSGRVLTVVQEPGSQHKDFGLIGFHEQPHASYLVFPRSLEKPAGSRVVGINYLLLEEPEVRDPVRNHEKHETRESRGNAPGRHFTRAPALSLVGRRSTRVPVPSTLNAPTPPKPSTRSYTVKLRRTATLESDVLVEAETQKVARERALALVKTQPFDVEKALVREKIIRIK